MTHTIEFLSDYSIADVFPVFQEAFSDYVQDASHVTVESFTNRAIKNGVEMAYSVGAFADGKMVGFTMVGIDQFAGKKSAYDAGTGIIKDYRGQGIAKEMLEALAEKLQEIGVENFILEVLKANPPAIKAYQKANFEIARELDSFELRWENAAFPENPYPDIAIHEIARQNLPGYTDCFDWQPSWENSLSSIARMPDEVMLIGARCQGQDAGILVYQPASKWIMCIAVRKEFRRKGVAASLLVHLKKEIGEQVPLVRIINVEHTDEGMIRFLEKVGFVYGFDQYEMHLGLI